MKKILFFTVAAATVMALTGCSQSSDLTEIDTTNNAPVGQKAISFDTYLATNTRAGVSGGQTTETLKTNGFGVLGYYTAQNPYSNGTTPNFMYNTKVSGTTTGTTTTWTYSPLLYWPNNDGDKISFFAYAPYVAVTPNTGNPTADATTGITAITSNAVSETPKISYKLAEDKTQSVDLLWGVKKGTVSDLNKDLTRTQANISGVGFTFKHALAMCCLQAKVATDDASFDPSNTKITIQNVLIESSALATNGKFDLTTGTWPEVNANGTMSSNIGKELINTNFVENSGSIINNSSSLNSISGLSTTAQNLFQDNTKSYYFIPVTTNTKATVTITYWTRTLDAKLANGCTNIQQTIKKDILLPAFAANKKYTLILNIGLNTVKFTADVADWTSDTDNGTMTVDVPEVIKQ